MIVEQIFDAFNKMSDNSYALHEIRSLEAQNRGLKNECGGCYMWMTKQCKREANGRKVTCGEMICNDFKPEQWTLDLIKKNDKSILSHKQTLSK